VCGIIVAGWVLAGGTLWAQDQRPGFSSSDLQRLASVGDVQVSPDGSRVAYVVATNKKSGAPTRTLWLFDVAAGRHVQVGDDTSFSSSPRWSPDGRWLAFLGRADGRSGLMLVRVDDVVSDPELIAPVSGTNHPFPYTGESFAWSPGSSRLAYVSAVAGPENDSGNGDPAVITRYLYKPYTNGGSTPFNDNRRLQLFMVDLVTKRPQQLTDHAYHYHSLDWSRSDDEILLVSNQGPDPDRVFNDDVFAFNVAKRTGRRITNTPGAEYDPVWSPDGKSIAMSATARPLTSSETTMEDTHIWVMKADGTGRRDVGASIDNRQVSPKWSADGAWLYFTVQERGDTRLSRVAAVGGTPEAVVPPAAEHGSIGRWSLTKTGMLAYALTTPGHPSELYIRQAGSSESQRVTALNDALVAERRLAEVERFTFDGDGGLKVEAFLTKPLDLDPTSRYPMIVSIHGGPHGQRGPSFDHQAQSYAAMGWATLMVNYRGSTGYGQAFADAIRGDQDGAEARDVLAGVEAALKTYAWLDADRLGIEGGSYGGQLTNWIVTQTTRFRAAVSTSSISNLVSFNYMAFYHDYLAVEFGAYPHEGTTMDLLFERSPIRHVARVRTPVLLMHGEADNDVPIAEAEQFFIALRDVGVDTVFVRYPREGHGLRETRHRIDALDRSIAWYTTYFSKPRFTTLSSLQAPRESPGGRK
jgi:dipeptidyl aminopeptidase/acylaminoacyl peptidase